MWIAFAVAAVAVFAAMGWITATVLRLDTAEAESRRQAQLEENVRLALWRMDSALAPLIAAEHARPYAAYHAAAAEAPAARGKGARQADVAMSDWFPTPPLPGEKSPFVRLYFQYAPDGTLGTPQAAGPAPPAKQVEDVARLGQVAPHGELLAALPAPSVPDVPVPLPEQVAIAQQQAIEANAQAADAEPDASQQQQQPEQPPPPTKGSRNAARQEMARANQQRRNAQEFRSRASNTARQVEVQSNSYGTFDLARGEVTTGVMHPVWRGEDLLLARRIAMPDGDYVQGCWVDWHAVREWLLNDSADLLPAARLEPFEAGSAAPDARLLASLPLRLVPGELSGAASSGAAASSPLRLSLVVAWACVLLASAAVAGLLRGVVSLSERRGAFVAAVTHELRTPLTTLRMYAEMLEGDMVPGADRRRHYLATLRAEADRLGHLVENVLAYSRLERRRAGTELVEAKLADLLRRPLERLGEHARQAGMTLAVNVPAAVADAAVRVNPTSFEQILFNLVDNACKYAAGGSDRTIHLDAERHGGRVLLTVRDHGPGLAPGHAGRLFKPFSKSVQEAANTAPGLGLGLALSQRLARSMGGSLTLERSTPQGTSFVLGVPTA